MQFKDNISVEVLREYFSYNPHSGIILRIKNSGKGKTGTEPGTWSQSRPNSNIRKKISFKASYYHYGRVAWALHTGHWPKGLIDHIDRNPLNNKFENLRESSVAENNRNVVQKKKSQLPTGVDITKYGRYRARIWVQGKCIQLGSYPTLEEAGSAYIEASKKFHKDFSPY